MRPRPRRSSALAAAAALAALALAASCTSSGTTTDDSPAAPKTSVVEDYFVADWERITKAWQIPPGRELALSPIYKTEKASLHELMIDPRGELVLHHHDASDETIVVVEGNGALLLGGGAKTPIVAGQLVHVPAGTAHGIVCEAAAEMPLRALVVFSPPLKEDDTKPGGGAGTGAKLRVVDLDKETPPAKGEGFFTNEVARGPHASVSIARVNLRVPLHKHETHAETIFVFDGQGLFRLGDAYGRELPQSAHAGLIVHIPPGRTHAFEHQATLRGGAKGNDTRAVTIFSPDFDGKDRVMLDDPALKQQAPPNNALPPSVESPPAKAGGGPAPR